MALSHVDPLAFNALRFPLASLLLLVVMKARGAVPLPPLSDVPRIVAVALLGNVLYQMFFIFGLNHTSAGNASLLLAGTPILTALLSASLGHEQVHPQTWLGVICTFAGIVLIVAGGITGEGGAAHSIEGDLLMLGASVTWAFYTVGARPLVQRHGSVKVTAWTLWAGTIGLLVCGAPALAHTDLQGVGAGTWAAIAYAGLLSIGLSYMIWYYGVSKLGNTRTSSYSNATPVIALLSAWLVLGETPKLIQAIGAAVIIGGVTIAQSSARVQREEVSPEV
jgi:drug/metabolite transporter (DMT)-like permease